MREKESSITFSYLMQAAGKRSGEGIPGDNLFREIGFDHENARLGWVIPPGWKKIEEQLQRFLEIVKEKNTFIFSGMGGSINTVKALIEILGEQSENRLYAIDSLDPVALEELLSSIIDLSKTLVVGISKSGTTEETQNLLKTVREIFQSRGLSYRNHFLWLTDLPNRAKIENVSWQNVEILPIQVDEGTDIGGRFSAPHTLILLLPLLLLLDGDIIELKTVWDEYLALRERLILEAACKASELAHKNTRCFAVVLEEPLTPALRTWITQLFQESLGSKIEGFDPKTLVLTPNDIPTGFESIRFDIASSKLIIKAMLTMYLFEVFVAVFAYYKGINFVNQPEVENYKKRMREVSSERVPQPERVSLTLLIERIKRLLTGKPNIRFIEVVCYWHLRERERNQLNATLRATFPDKEILVFVGSDWNHHSYQAASKNEDTLFVILTSSDYETKIPGIKEHVLRQNIATLKTIAYATYSTLEDKAGYFELITNKKDISR